MNPKPFKYPDKENTMKIHQISLFLENKPGQLKHPCKQLSDAGVNILTLSLADTQQYGILRMIVDDWKKAREIFEKSGTTINIAEVIAVEVEDKPGGLAKVLGIIEKCKINIEYMYAFTFGINGKAVLIFKLENLDEAIKLLQSKGVNPISPVHLSVKVS
jgi:hypothetical protein